MVAASSEAGVIEEEENVTVLGVVVLDVAVFLGLPRPLTLPSPLGKSLKISGKDGVSAAGLMGEAVVEEPKREGGAEDDDDDEEEFSFKVNFNFLEGAATVTLSLIKTCSVGSVIYANHPEECKSLGPPQ